MDPRYAAAAGLTWGTACLHGLEVLEMLTGLIHTSPKMAVAIGGIVIYGAATALLAGQRRSGAWLILAMPFVGGALVVLGHLLGLAMHLDIFNLVIFAVQLPGVVLAAYILGLISPSRPARSNP